MGETESTIGDIRDILSKVFGFSDLRPGQKEVIERVLEGRPTLAVMPTGAGKSLCYQLPALALPGLTVVVSPLVALMQDQVDRLCKLKIPAAAWNSSLNSTDWRNLQDRLNSGQIKLLYVAPERFRNESSFQALLRLRPTMLAIDEVHCISQWGHNFRPDYARLGEVYHRFQEQAPTRLIGLTATATEKVRVDIATSLGVSDEIETIVTGFDRPNLALSVITLPGGKNRIEYRLNAIKDTLSQWLGDDGCAIIYVPTRKHTEEIADSLKKYKIKALAYHAGLSSDERSSIQRRFDQEQCRIIVATTAFGMGIDKPNVRVVIHTALPDAPESYYQEVGRAGRDGKPAAGVLLWDQSDLRYAYHRLESSCPTPELVQRAKRLARDVVSEHPDQIVDLDFLVARLESSLGPAARAAFIALEQSGDLSISRTALTITPGEATVCSSELEQRAKIEGARLSAAIGYVSRAACRRRYLVDYFGDVRRADKCGVCDRCTAPPAIEATGPTKTAALMVLSCIARMRGRYGKTRVAQVLKGSTTKPITDTNLDKLSTHGLLSTWTQQSIMELIDSLVRADLARLTLDTYPCIHISQDGADVLKQQKPILIDFQIPTKNQPSPKPAKPSNETTEPLSENAYKVFNALKAWRKEESSSQGKPPFVIAHDSLLKNIANQCPTTLDGLGALKGLGNKRLERYGPTLLEVIATALTADVE